MTPMDTNVLYYGDNLGILRHHIPPESVDLVYLDPPFNSQATYNVLFREQSGAASHAQIEAFEDTWHWGDTTAQSYDSVIRGPQQDVARMLQAMVDGLGHNQVTAYLVMMAARLIQLHRVLKPTGSIYLHCDPTASHYLKTIMDSVFGPLNFRNEIIWRRTGAHNKARRFAPIHDVLLFYTKSDERTWTFPTRPYMKGHVEEFFVKDGDTYKTAYFGNVLTGSGVRTGESGQPWRGIDPTEKGRHWAIPRKLIDEVPEDFSGMTQRQKLDRLYELGYIKISPGDAWPSYEHAIKPGHGQPMGDIWAFQPYTGGTVFGTEKGVDEDVRWLSTRDKERLGYPTQKPLSLLERIITASSHPGDIVLDPFCGCGTAVHAAEKLGRRWIGIDITFLAINLIERRMRHAFPGIGIEVIGEPVDLSGARALADQDKYQFQWWALLKLEAQPVSGKKKGSDRGIDGVIPFVAGPKDSDYKRAIVSVKGGEHVGVQMIRDLVGVLDREKEPIGVLLAPPTRDMVTEAAAAGFYESELWKKKYARVQILTVDDLLGGKKPDMPWGGSPFAKAPKEKEKAEQGRLE